MENTKITITPLALTYSPPTNRQLSLLIKFKRILISTGYELQKFECKKTFPFKTTHNAQLDLRPHSAQTSIGFSLVRQMELSNTKVDIIVIGLLNMGKDVNLLGIATLDLGVFEHYQGLSSEFRKQLRIPLQKCDDPGSYITVQVSLKNIQRPNRMQRNKKNHIEPMGILETEGFAKDSFIESRRQTADMPTAYEISHRNYKQVQITRTEEHELRQINEQSMEKSVSSYKKRFQYQYDNAPSRIAKKSNNSSQIVGGGPKPHGRQSPTPRLKTPEPIISGKGKAQKSTSYLKQRVQKREHNQMDHSNITDSPQKIQKNKNRREYSGPICSDSHAIEQTPSMEAIKDNKFKMITEKLQQIEQRIMRGNTTQSKQQQIENKEDSEEEDEPKQELLIPKPFKEEPGGSFGQIRSNELYESEVAHFSPSDSSNQMKRASADNLDNKGQRKREIEKKDSPKRFIVQSQPIQVNQAKIQKEQNSDGKGDQPLEKKSPKPTNKFSQKLNTSEEQQSSEYPSTNLNRKKYRGEEKKLESVEPFAQQNAPLTTISKQFAQVPDIQPDKVHEKCEQKISCLENELDEQQEKFRKQMMEKQLEYRQKINENHSRVESQLNQLKELRNQVVRQKALIDKLNNLYEESDDKNFQLAKDYEKKCMEYDRKLDALVKKNNELNTNLAERDQQIHQYQEQIQQLKKDIEDYRKQIGEIQAHTAAIPRLSNSQASESLPRFSDSSERKSDRKSQQQLVAAKKKCVNLQAQIRYKQNQIRFLKIKNDNLLQEKKDLQNEIDMIAANNKQEMAKQGSISKMNLESISVSNSVKMENKALKEQINSLRSQVHELNTILEGIITQSQLNPGELASTLSKKDKKKKEDDEIVMHKKYVALQQKAEAYADQIRNKQDTIAQIINLVWSYGNPQLMEEISKLVTEQRNRSS